MAEIVELMKVRVVRFSEDPRRLDAVIGLLNFYEEMTVHQDDLPELLRALQSDYIAYNICLTYLPHKQAYKVFLKD